MRTFIAVTLPDEIKDYLYELQKKLKELPAKIKWVSKSQIHLTLKFLGELPENKIKEVKDRLTKAKFKPFTVSLNGMGVFPSKKYVRVVWVGLKPAGKVIELQQKVDAELLDMFPKEQKFSAHITLGRVKFVKDKESFAKILEKATVEEKSFEIKNFKLMKSTLTKDGAIYEELAVF